jgi:hypothetical protein
LREAQEIARTSFGRAKHFVSWRRAVVDTSKLKLEQLRNFADSFLKRYLDPAFGVLSKSEIDLLVFSLLHEQNIIPTNMSQYEIARLLCITPTRVRTLTMQMQLRDTAQTDDNLRGRIITCLVTSRFTKDGNQIQFGIEDPLLREDVAARLKQLGATADSSFNREMVKIQVDAFVDLIGSLLTADQKKTVEAALRKAGVEKKGWRGVLRGAIGKLGEKVAGKAGEMFAEEIGDLVGPAVKDLFGAGASTITSSWKQLFEKAKVDEIVET